MIYVIFREVCGVVWYVEYYTSRESAEWAVDYCERFYRNYNVKARHYIVPMLRWL